MVILYILILVLAFPTGLLLAWLSRDELIAGKKWFLTLAVVSLASATVISFINFELKFPSILTLFFISIISLVAVWKSYDQKWGK